MVLHAKTEEEYLKDVLKRRRKSLEKNQKYSIWYVLASILIVILSPGPSKIIMSIVAALFLLMYCGLWVFDRYLIEKSEKRLKQLEEAKKKAGIK